MAHTHAAENGNTYYLEQLCSIGFCGALGVVQILLYQNKVLEKILTDKFHVWVLTSGIVLTGIAVLRGVALWVAAGKANSSHQHNHDCGHDHDHEDAHGHTHEHEHSHTHGVMAAEHVHTHACDHDHDEHTHEHAHADASCGHDHGWAPWRYVVLLLPVVLFLMDMPAPAVEVKEDPVEPGVEVLGFTDLQKYSGSKESREFWNGKLVRLKGQFAPGRTDKTFTLFRLKMTCCAADAYPLNVTIEAPEPLAFEKLQGQWVNATGRVKFERPPGRDDWVTSLQMRTNDDVKLTAPDPRPLQ